MDGFWEGAERATGTIAQTGMGLLKLKQEQANDTARTNLMQQEMNLRQEQAQREKLIFEREEQKRQEAEMRYNTPVTASKFFPKIREFPSFKQSLKDGFDALGLPYQETEDGDIIAKQGHGQEVLKWIAESGERSDAQAKGIFGDLQAKKMTLLEQLASAKKPEEQKAISDQLAVISDQQAQVVGSSWKMQEEIQKNKLKEKEKVPEIKSVDLGDRVEVYEDGKLTGTKRKGKLAGEGGGQGKAPSGYRYTKDGDLEPIPGGPADIKAQERSSKQTEAIATIDDTIASFDKLLNHPGRKTATGLSGKINPKNYIWGSDATTYDVLLKSIDAKMFMSKIGTFKGLGALSDAEGKKMSLAVGALDRKMSDEAHEENLKAIRDGFILAKQRIESGNLLNKGNKTSQNVIKYDAQGNRI